MIKRIMILLFLLINTSIYAQKDTALVEYNLHLNLHTVPNYYDVSFEMLFVKDNFKWGPMVGLSLKPARKDEYGLFTLPVLLMGTYGKKHNVEMGIGATYFSLPLTEMQYYFIPTARIGYRLWVTHDVLLTFGGGLYKRGIINDKYLHFGVAYSFTGRM